MKNLDEFISYCASAIENTNNKSAASIQDSIDLANLILFSRALKGELEEMKREIKEMLPFIEKTYEED